MIHLPPYPISMKKSVNRVYKSPLYKLDKDGVVLYKIPYTQKFDYYPVNIAQYALGHYEEFMERRREDCKEEFLKNVDWLLENLTFKGEMAVWLHRYTLPYGYNFKVPWVHGMGQSLGASAILRAYYLTGEKKYLDVVEPIIKSFDVNISSGGVKFVDENGDVWFEEYGVIPPVHILNGFMFILIGLYEMNKYVASERAGVLFSKGILTLKKNIHRYDIGYWSLYDLLHKYPAMWGYHNLHIKQLKVLSEFTGEKIFINYAKRWEDYEKSRIKRIKARLKRGFVHLEKLGVGGAINRYREIREYNKER